MPYISQYLFRDVELRAGGQLISPTGKELTTSSNCSRNQQHGVILIMQLNKIASMTIKKA